MYAQFVTQIKMVALDEAAWSAEWSNAFPCLQLLIHISSLTFSDVKHLEESTKEELLSEDTVGRVRRDALAAFKESRARLKGNQAFRYQMVLDFGEFTPGDFGTLEIFEIESYDGSDLEGWMGEDTFWSGEMNLFVSV